jgi:hypothetical protein
MELFNSFWIQGYRPTQFLVILAFTFLAFVAVQYLLKRMGKSIPVFGQAILTWLTAYVLLKYVIYPPIPSALLYTYMGLITVVVFLLISSTEKSWEAFKRPMMATLAGGTRRYIVVRGVVFTVLPVLALIGTYSFMKPAFEEPAELRAVHPYPPRSITVHGVTYDLQTARNPFRVAD